MFWKILIRLTFGLTVTTPAILVLRSGKDRPIKLSFLVATSVCFYELAGLLHENGHLLMARQFGLQIACQVEVFGYRIVTAVPLNLYCFFALILPRP